MTDTRLTKQPAFGFNIHADTNSPTGLRCEFHASPPPLRVLSFKGGAARVFVYRAVLTYFHENGLLEQLEEIGGSSAGCIAATFACIPYENPEERNKSIDTIFDSNLFDVMGKSSSWYIYQTLTYPLSLVSNSISWLSNITNNYSSKLSNTYLEKLAGYTLNISSSIIGIIGKVASPNTYAGAYNFITGGGIYLGNETQNQIRDQLQQDVQLAVERLLKDANVRESILQHLIDINLIELINGSIKVKPEVTFKHFYELSKLPGSQFKQCYITGTRIDDGELVVFNKDNTPDMPLHVACRIACAFPTLWTRVTYEGQTYFDGGVLNNSPVDLANNKQLSNIHEFHGITDKLARLNVRVEYPYDHPYHLWRKKPEPGYISSITDYIYQTLVRRFILSGLDAFEAEKVSIRTLQNDYPQRTLQLSDYEIGHLDLDKIKEVRDDICNKLIPEIDAYFMNHGGEKIIINYDCPSTDCDTTTMPIDMQTELVRYLSDRSHKTEDIFMLQNKSAQELENLRTKLISHLSQTCTDHTNDSYCTTAKIANELNISPIQLTTISDNSLPTLVAATDISQVTLSSIEMLLAPRPH
jgi:predicted acylesterase/phospholipase RssA